jgi:gliding motility-associated-like protein
LADFTGEMTLGDWTLIVADTFSGDGGFINLFELELCVVGELAQDSDGDGINDLADNCPDIANGDQADLDGDGIGDFCDDDRDGDGVLNSEDNCPDNANSDQGDLNGNGIGDFCDVECQVQASVDLPITIAEDEAGTYTTSVMIMDPVQVSDVNVTVDITHTWVNDLILTLTSPSGTNVVLSNQNGGFFDQDYTNTVFDQEAEIAISSGTAPFTGSFQPDGDLSTLYGEGSVGEWTLTVEDVFGPLDGGSINIFELEVCGIRDPFDYDADGVLNDDDNCVFIANADQSDTDGDGLGDSCDPDIDNDGILNEVDNCDYVVNVDQSDIDGDGLGDACDPDIDNDNVLNEDDNCPETPNEDQSDVDRNGIGDVCDNLIVNDVLTPNSDGFNDTWEIINLERFQDAKIHVYNRWGNEVFSSSNYDNSWNGTSGSSGNALPAGSYFYQIDQNGDGTVVLTGWIYITY